MEADEAIHSLFLGIYSTIGVSSHQNKAEGGILGTKSSTSLRQRAASASGWLLESMKTCEYISRPYLVVEVYA